MPKAKTRKVVSKRIKVSSRGKLRRLHAETSHLRSKEDASTRSRKGKIVRLSKSDVNRVRKQLPYS